MEKLHDTQLGDSESDEDAIRSFEREIRDLQITNRAKDLFIEQLRQERDGFFDQLLTASRTVGELETKLLQLKGPVAVEKDDRLD